MLVEQSLLTKLKDFGLNTYESKLWVALLSRGSSTAGELSDIARVPRSRSYDVLESLEKKGFIIVKLGKPIKYVAVSPEEAIDRVKKKIKERSEQQLNVINELKAGKVLEQLDSLHLQGAALIDPSDRIGYIKGRENIYNHLEAMAGRAKRSIILATTEEGLARKQLFLEKPFADAKSRGVDIKVIAPLTSGNSTETKSFSKHSSIKHTSTDSRFMIIDGKEMAFMLTGDKEVHESYDSAIWVNTGLFVSALEKMFNKNWHEMSQ